MMSRTTPRFVALTQGLIAEVALGGALLVWLGSPNSAGRALFGPVVSKAVLVAAMIALAVAMLALVLAARLGKVVLRTCVLVGSLFVAGVGALAVGGLFSDPGGPVILLGMAWIFSVLVVVAISRTERA
jgi:hypothetical protein